MGVPALTGRQWISVGISVAVLALGVIVVSRAVDGPTGVRVDLATSGDRRRGQDTAATETGDDSSGAATSSTAVASTTSMPPRAQPVRQEPTAAGPLSGTIIVVDPGHNGLNFHYSDVGRAGSLDGDGPACNTAGASTNTGLDEMVVNWQIGTRLATILRALGSTVVLTHGDLNGFGPCADERGAIARDLGATALISIHADGSAPESTGFHIVHPAAKAGLDPATITDSARLANTVRDELVLIGGRPANYVGTAGVQERADLANLNTANRPSILAELGNLRNTTDAFMLASEFTYVQIARALARSLLRYLLKPVTSPLVSADASGDGWPDFLAGSPQAAAAAATTTTTTSTTLPVTTTSAAPAPTVAPTTEPHGDPAPTQPGTTEPAPTVPIEETTIPGG